MTKKYWHFVSSIYVGWFFIFYFYKSSCLSEIMEFEIILGMMWGSPIAILLKSLNWLEQFC